MVWRKQLPLQLKLVLVLAFLSACLIACKIKEAPTPDAGNGSAVSTSERNLVESTQLPTPIPTPTPIPIPKVANPWQPGGFYAGVTVLQYGSDEYFDEKFEALLDKLVALNVNSLTLVFPFYQDRYYSSEVIVYGQTPSDAIILSFIKRAHARGFHVTVRPLIDEDGIKRDIPEWRGTIRPQNVDAWFASYTELLLKYATLAQAEGAEMFSIGVELNSMAHPRYAARWEAVCARIKEVYSGALTYAMNHGAENSLPCTDQLAVIGIDAFYENAVPAPTEEHFIASWQRHLAYFEAVKQRFGKPLIFSEVGVRSQVNAHVKPYVWSDRTPPDLELQRAYYAATCKAVTSVISGFFFWNADLDAPENPATDSSFEFIGKPAEQALASCYQEVR